MNAGEEDSGSPATEDDDVGPDHRPVPQHRPGCDPPVLKGPLWGPLEGKLIGTFTLSKVPYFYRTHVHMGSDHWVALSFSIYETFLKPCEDCQCCQC